MSSIGFDEAVACYDAIAVELDKVAGLDRGSLSPSERQQLLQRRETLGRRLPALDHEHINELTHVDPDELGGSLARVLADRLRISRSEASRRIAEAADLGERRAMTGEPLAPKFEATAAGQRAGLIGGRAGEGDPGVFRPAALLHR